jgi:hypothetical protein
MASGYDKIYIHVIVLSNAHCHFNIQLLKGATVPKSKPLLTPKFLTADIAKDAVEAALTLVYSPLISGAIDRTLKEHLHIVVLVPGMTDHYEEDYPDCPDYPLKPVLLYEESRGNPADFAYPFDNIARCKALQLWTDRNDDRTDIQPHLLFKGDTPFWGGVKRRGIVVSCSGLQPWVDKLISGIVADTIVALAHDWWEHSNDKADEELCFLT